MKFTGIRKTCLEICRPGSGARTFFTGILVWGIGNRVDSKCKPLASESDISGCFVQVIARNVHWHVWC